MDTSLDTSPKIHPVVYPVIGVALAIIAGFSAMKREAADSTSKPAAAVASLSGADARSTAAGPGPARAGAAKDVTSAKEASSVKEVAPAKEPAAPKDVAAAKDVPAVKDSAPSARSGDPSAGAGTTTAKPEAKPESGKTAKAGDSNSDNRAAAPTDTASKPEAKPEVKAEAKVESKAKPEAKAESKSAAAKAPEDAAESASTLSAGMPSEKRAENSGIVAMTFAYGSSQLTTEGRRALTDLVARVAAEKPAVIILSGHTDSVGPARKNRALSRQRINEVASLMRADGFKGRIRTAVKGESQPYQVASSGDLTQEARMQLDRRVEARFVN